MKSLRKIPVPRLAALAAGIGVVGLLVWFMFLGNALHRAGDSGESSPANAPGGVATRETTTPPWSSEEQKAKAAEREARRRKTFELYAELTKGLPELQPKLEGIPEFEANGYERLVALVRAREEDLPEVPDEFMEMLEGKRPWDGPAVQEYLKKHAELLAELDAISRLPAGEVDWETSGRIVAWAPIRTMGNILCLSVLDAAHNGNPTVALELMVIMDRLARHLRGPADGDAAAYTYAVLLQGRHFHRMAPLVSKLADNSHEIVDRLEAILQRHRLVPEDMARYWRGENVSTALTMLLPMVLGGPQSFEPLNPEEVKSLLRLKFERNVRELKVMSEANNFTELKERLDKFVTTETGPRGLSSDAQRLFEELCNDSRRTHSFFVRFETRRQLALAAVRLARDDGAPEKILAEIAASEPEPRKLHYDPATRMLTSEPFLTETEKTSIQVP